MSEEERLVKNYIERLRGLLITATGEKAERTMEEIEEMINTAEEYKTIIPF